MNILINFLSATSGGSLSYLRNLAPKFIEYSNTEDIKITLLIGQSQSRDLGLDRVDGVFSVPVRGLIHRMLWERTKLKKIISDEGVDVLFTPYQFAPYFKNVHNVVMIRNMEPFLFRRYRYSFANWARNFLLEHLSKRSLLKADGIIACSQFAYDHCVHVLKLSSSKIKKVYHGRDVRFISSTKSDDQSKLGALGLSKSYVFTCGSLLPYRRLELIVKAFAETESSRNMSLVVAGSGTDKKYGAALEKLVREYPQVDIKMLGQVSPDVMPVLYRSCDLFITATDIEACPNIAIEAMSCGCSILSSNNAPMPEMFGQSAEYFDQKSSIKELAHRIDSQLHSGSAINAKALERAQDFDWEKCFQQTLNFILKDSRG